MTKQSPVIVMKPEQRQRFEEKRKEYHQRLNQQIVDKGGYWPPEEFSAWYALRIINELLKEGRVVTWDFCRKIAAEHGGVPVRTDYLTRYLAVIDHYTKEW